MVVPDGGTHSGYLSCFDMLSSLCLLAGKGLLSEAVMNNYSNICMAVISLLWALQVDQLLLCIPLC